MSQKPELKLDWCSYDAAKYAVEHWHYSQLCPVGKQVRLGVWEDKRFIGAVIWMPGANNHLVSRYGLTPFQGAELVRVALSPTHATPTSRIVSIGLRLLRASQPGLRLIVSYADPVHGHHGGIYQAMGWIYTGIAEGFKQYWLKGKWYHERTIRLSSQWSSVKGVDVSCVPTRTLPGKHRYLYPFDADIRGTITPLAQPYPKRAASIAPDAPSDQGGEEGRQPIAALQVSGGTRERPL